MFAAPASRGLQWMVTENGLEIWSNAVLIATYAHGAWTWVRGWGVE